MSKLLSTGSCSLHAIHGAFKTGEQSTDWKLKQVLRAWHQILQTHQLGEIITLISLEVVDFLFHFVVHGSKMKM